jgi:glycine hydroxymethyltransferase
MDQLAEAISLIVKEKEAGVEKAKAIVMALTAKYPLM